MIELQNLTKSYDGRSAAVEALDLRIETGELVALVGPSGCGKTTTLSMINRLEEPSAGAVLIDGRNTRAGNPVELRRHIGFVFQDIGLFPHMTVGENAGIVLRILGEEKNVITRRVRELLTLVGLAADAYSNRLPAQLSGGERQRVGVARALAASPAIMLMDEPFGAIDPLARDGLVSDYHSIHTRLGLTTVVVTHDMTEAILLADRIALMRNGKLVQVGSPRQLFDAPADDFVRAMMDTPRRRARALATTIQA
jgi:osmoprotectant transport system ATP-binding protein